MVPLQASMDGPAVNYLSFDVRPDNDTDALVFEARYGKLRAYADAKVPFLAPHDHSEKKN
jgi:hypothetical protein